LDISVTETVETGNGPPWAAQEASMTGKTGTLNVLYDLGLDDAADLTARAQLAIKLNDLIDKRGLTQAEVAALTGMTQPKISQIRHYKLRNISLERLMRALVSLDQHVEIRVRKVRQSDAAGISVAA
jgi:predicted XRE-type DNA-binding protein